MLDVPLYRNTTRGNPVDCFSKQRAAGEPTNPGGVAVDTAPQRVASEKSAAVHTINQAVLQANKNRRALIMQAGAVDIRIGFGTSATPTSLLIAAGQTLILSERDCPQGLVYALAASITALTIIEMV